ncbi:hypothetical protein E2562_015725 [Oryza meyeriana var. granulata]|uniref:Secreted protein n=1 Tax=Oryza meyeriana var. granulata TaxID=110450 RepID=A0A6G1D3D6_9ORYZ|nr:hypothetical protein E2562_015725 [Oryza meyeriana var. granulata]
MLPELGSHGHRAIWLVGVSVTAVLGPLHVDCEEIDGDDVARDVSSSVPSPRSVDEEVLLQLPSCHAIAKLAAVGLSMMRSTVSPAMAPVSFVACGALCHRCYSHERRW